MAIDVLDKGQAVLAEFVEGLVTVMLGDRFTQPLPKTFNRVEVGAVARERENLEAQLFGIRAHLATAMIGSAIPNEDDLTVGLGQPVRELLEKADGGLTIAFALFPEETGAISKVVSAKAVEAC